MRDLTIGEAARRAGVGVETIRFYERRGLVEQPPRPHGAGFRVYPAEQIRRIKFIRQAQQLGFSLREIAELLSLRADPAADCSMVRKQAITKLGEVRGKLEQLRRIGSALETLVANCPGEGDLQVCSILDALVEAGPAVAGDGQLPAVPPKRRRGNETAAARGKEGIAT